MKPKIFIDGEHGTTGLQIRARLAKRDDLDVLSIPEAERRNRDMRADFLKSADIAILCLPDDASREAVGILEGVNSTRVIDTSTAHRVNPEWTYGFAEMDGAQRALIAKSRLVANPGCYPTGAISLTRPLVAAGILPADYPVSVNAVSGYTGGGKQMIAQMEDPSRRMRQSMGRWRWCSSMRIRTPGPMMASASTMVHSSPVRCAKASSIPIARSRSASAPMRPTRLVSR